MRWRRTHLPSREEELELFAQGYRLVAGVDEAGRGPLAGPVVAGAVILPPGLEDSRLAQVRDSKLLTFAMRERLYPLIRRYAQSVGAGIALPQEIDSWGIVKATRRAMSRAIAQLQPTPQFLLIDAVPLPEAGIPYKAIIHGDALCLSIAAASIIAKVTRDRLMETLDAEYPGYGFARHKGYPTREHLALLWERGPCPIHRRAFAPVKRLLERADAQPP